MNLYSIPPLLTLLCFIGLALLTVLRGQRTKTNLLFLIICILGSFLYIDILFVFNAKSAKTALTFSRFDHFFVIYLFAQQSLCHRRIDANPVFFRIKFI